MFHISQEPGPSTRTTRSNVNYADGEDFDMGDAPIDLQTESQRLAENRDLPLQHFLTLNSITNADIMKLSSVGYPTVRSVADAPAHILEKKTGLSTVKVSKLQAEANLLFPVDFVTATHMHKLSKEMVRISTGSEELNRLLRGGIDTGTITGVFGESGSGKTQLCMTLAVRCQMAAGRGGAEGKCIFIDTVGGFKPARIAEIATANGLNVGEVMDNILYICPKTTDQLLMCFAKIKAYMVNNRTSLLLIDSGTALFRVEYSGRACLHERQSKLNLLISLLRECISLQNVSVVITAEVMDVPDPYNPRKVIVGGNIIKHGCHSLIQMRSCGKEAKVVCTFKFAEIAVLEVKVQIGPRGIEDYVEPKGAKKNGEDE